MPGVRVTSQRDAIVVGSGPNGLAAAVRLASRGLDVGVIEAAEEIGGGTRTQELTLPGVLHDVCSASHPFGAASPYFRSLPLDLHGLQWAETEVACAHPLSDGRGAAMYRSIDRTVTELGVDGGQWSKRFRRPSEGFDRLAPVLLGPPIELARTAPPVPELASFGLTAARTATAVAASFDTEEAAALFTGSAAHAIQPLSGRTPSAVGAALICAGHAYGWPVALGGSRSITDALAAYFRSLGGTIQLGMPVLDVSDLPPHRLLFLDTSPPAAADLLGSRQPSRVASAYRSWRFGPGAFKLDLAISGHIPWTYGPCRAAGVVHVGGTAEEIQAAESAVSAGIMPERPFVLVGQQYLADPARSAGDVNPIWAYAHVPNGWTGDASTAIVNQIERFAPGFRDQIVATASMGTKAFGIYNANYRGGDIAGGATSLRQVAFRPRPAIDPYFTGVDGVYLCSSSTPPGAGVHGMCGYHAVASAMRRERI